MNCKIAKKNISSWVDGELKSSDQREFEGHIANCASCQQEAESLKAFNSLLRVSAERIEPTFDFDSRFWKKAFEREKEPWFARVLKDLESLIPTPNFRQAFAVLSLALLIGGAGGAVSAMNSTNTAGRLSGGREAVQYLSGFREFGGLPSSSVAATYLRTGQEGKSS